MVEKVLATVEMHYTDAVDFEDVRTQLHDALTGAFLAGAFDRDETMLLGIGRIDVEWQDEALAKTLVFMLKEAT